MDKTISIPPKVLKAFKRLKNDVKNDNLFFHKMSLKDIKKIYGYDFGHYKLLSVTDEKLREFLNYFYGKEWFKTIDEVADELGYSKVRLVARIQEVFGTTFYKLQKDVFGMTKKGLNDDIRKDKNRYDYEFFEF